MDLTARQEEILSMLKSDGRIEVERLAERFAVTRQTIRRDLGNLCDLGYAFRIHGGTKRIPVVANRAYRERRLLSATRGRGSSCAIPRSSNGRHRSGSAMWAISTTS